VTAFFGGKIDQCDFLVQNLNLQKMLQCEKVNFLGYRKLQIFRTPKISA
jgi:hypothetical protein